MSILRPSKAAAESEESIAPRIIHSPEHSSSLRSLEGVPFIAAIELLESNSVGPTEELAAAVAVALATALRGSDARDSAWNRAAVFEGVSNRVPASGENTSLFSQRNQGAAK